MQEGGEHIMYNNAIDLAKGTKTSIAFTVHLATVKSLTADGRAYVQFYGDSEASGKLYPYVAGYKPAVNDDVLMLKQGSTYIIIGKYVSLVNVTADLANVALLFCALRLRLDVLKVIVISYTGLIGKLNRLRHVANKHGMSAEIYGIDNLCRDISV